MSEAIEQATTQALPLEDKHREHGAEFAGRDGWLVPASYGATSDEYSFVRDEGAGLIDLSPRGRIIVSGTEAVPFLNGLITNDVKALEPGGWMAAAFPNVQGRLQAFVRLINQDNKYLIDTEAVTHERVHKLLE